MMGEEFGDLIKPTSLEKWSYKDHLKEYLLLLASRGSEGLESINRFPKQVELSDAWHQVLNDMRDASQDGIERLALVGFQEDRRRIFLPTIPVKGASKEIPIKILNQEILRAKNKFGMRDLIADIHSHPKDLYSGWRGKARIVKATIEGVNVKYQPHLSAGDLYRIVSSSNYQVYPEFLPMIGVAHGNANIFAFKTRETIPLPVPSESFDQKSFSKYWNEKYGFSYSRDEGITGIKSSKANHWAMNIGIAKKHKLALYRGGPGRDLVRAFP